MRNWLTTRSVTPLLPPRTPYIALRICIYSKRVDLIKKNHTRAAQSSPPEDSRDRLLALPHVLGIQFRPLHRNEIHIRLRRHRFRQQRLRAARWAIQQHSFRRRDVEVFELRRIAQRPLDQLLQPRLHRFQPADVRPAHLHFDQGDNCTCGIDTTTSRRAEGRTRGRARFTASAVLVEIPPRRLQEERMGRRGCGDGVEDEQRSFSEEETEIGAGEAV